MLAVPAAQPPHAVYPDWECRYLPGEGRSGSLRVQRQQLREVLLERVDSTAVHWNHQLARVDENDSEVVATFANGAVCKCAAASTSVKAPFAEAVECLHASSSSKTLLRASFVYKGLSISQPLAGTCKAPLRSPCGALIGAVWKLHTFAALISGAPPAR